MRWTRGHDRVLFIVELGSIPFSLLTGLSTKSVMKFGNEGDFDV